MFLHGEIDVLKVDYLSRINIIEVIQRYYSLTGDAVDAAPTPIPIKNRETNKIA